MADAYAQIAPDSTGKKVDTEELAVGANTVERQRVQVAGKAAADIAPVDSVTGLAVAVRDIALVVRHLLQQINRPMSMDPSSNRIRQSLENIAAGVTLPTVSTVTSVTSVATVATVNTVTTVTTVTTVATLTSMTQLRGFDVKDTLLNATERALWGTNIRARISG